MVVYILNLLVDPWLFNFLLEMLHDKWISWLVLFIYLIFIKFKVTVLVSPAGTWNYSLVVMGIEVKLCMEFSLGMEVGLGFLVSIC